VKDNALVEWSKASKKPLKNFFCHLKTDQDRHLYKRIASHHLTIVGKKLKDGSMLIVCSNANNPTHILSTYKKRWSIESMFKNLKTQGFNMEDTHMTCVQRLKKLMAVVAIATFCMCLIGSYQTCSFKKTVNTPLYS
jgi:transposase